jgi:cell division septum initiation protein DivIVA
MPRPNPPSRPSNQRAKRSSRQTDVEFDIIEELERLQEIIITESSQIPLTPWRVMNENKLLDQIEIVSDSLPDSIQKAQALLEQKEDIILEAQQYAQQIIQSAQQRAAQLLDETGIIQHAEQQASQIRQQVQQECEALQTSTLTDIDQMRRSAHQELQQLRQQTLAECDAIQQGADEYADAALTDLEQKLGEMLSIVRNGRQQINRKSPSPTIPKKLPTNSVKRPQ